MLRGSEVPRRSIGHCPRCGSRLLQLREGSRARRIGDNPAVDDMLRLVGIALLDRRCPECEHRDSVATTTHAAAASYREDTRRLLALQALADSVAAAAPLPPVACIEAPVEHSPA
jgi:DNA-directed RNA polymerase subunit RPC12/RpoP